MDFHITTIKEMCRDIIKMYTFHVRDKVKEGIDYYIETGIDDDIDKYKEVFLTVLSYTLGVDESDTLISNKLLEESKKVLNTVILNKSYTGILTKHRLMIYTTCEVMFEMVMKELGYNVNKGIK